MNLEENWTPELVLYLRSVTRELKFDWNAVAHKVQEFAIQENANDAVITPATCRKWFASDYHVTVTGTTSTTSSGENVEEAVEDVLPSPKMESLMKDYEDMSMDELVAHVETQELQMKQRKEEIFGRVLNSLGGGAANIESTFAFNSANNTTTTTSYSDYELTRQAYADNLAIKEAERLKKLALVEEQAEKVRLEKERDTLKRRFEQGSADGEGEDPLAHIDNAGAGYKYGDSSSVRAAGEKLSPEMEFIDSMPYDPNVTEALENFMETDEFDAMLSELEREIDAMAPSKGQHEAPSELSEILRVLETAAAANTARSESKRAAPIVLPPSPPRDNHVDVAGTRRGPARAALLDSSASGKETQTGKLGGDYTTAPSGVAQPTSAPASASSAPAPERLAERTAPKELQYGSRRGQATAEVVRAESDEEEEGGAFEGSDSEDDWRSMRNKQKKTADRVRPTASAAANITPSKQAPQAQAQRPAQPAPGGAFWGAYGGAPTVRNTVKSSAESVSVGDDVEDVRFNSAIAEYAQSVGLNLNRSESESEESEEEEEEETPAPQPESPAESVEERKPSVRYEIIESSESEEEEAPTRNLWFKEPISTTMEALPSPPKQTKDPALPPSPPKEFTPLSAVAPLAPVQAASGLLGGAGARRAKGKAGSIMSAARPRKGGAEEVETAPTVESTPAETMAPVFAPVAGVVSAPAVAAVDVAAVEPSPEVEEPVPEPVVSAADLVAAQVQRAVALDKVATAVLSPLPYAYISNKASGSVAEFSVSSLPAKFESVGGSVERTVLVDVNIAALRAVSHCLDGDVAWVSVVAWLMEVAGPNFAVLGMQCGTPSGASEVVCRLVLETSSDRVTDSDLIYLCRSTPLSFVVHLPAGASTAEAEPTLADFLHIRDSMTAPLMSDLEFFSQQLGNTVLVPHLQAAVARAETESPVILAHARDIAVCAVKSHVLSNQHLSSASTVGTSSTVLTALVAQAERAGLRLCGMRLVHLNALELFEYENMCSIPAYTRPSPPAEPSHNHSFNAHILPVLCLAFHSSSSAPVDHTAQAAHAATSTAKNAINTNTHSAANVLRALLGPEDPALARKTDPLSLRALYGTSKEHNLAYPLPHSVDRLFKETAFWFGGRHTSWLEDPESKSLSLLRIGAPHKVQIGVTVEADRNVLDASSASQLSALQISALRSVCERFDDLGQLVSFNCFGSSAAYRAALRGNVQHVAVAPKHTEQPAEGDASVEGVKSSLQLLWTFESHVAEAYLAHSAAAIQSKVAAAGAAPNSTWHVDVSWSTSHVDGASPSFAAKGETESHLSGSRLVALEMLKKVGEDDVKSHEDVGLPDVVVVSVGDTHHTHDVSPVSVLSSVLAMLPRTCEATIIAAKAVHHGAGLTAVLRGYQVLENIDYAVSEVQRIAGGGASPGKGAAVKPVTAQSKPAVEHRANLCDTMKIHRGKRALEMIFTEFPLTSIYTDLAVRDLHTYVPLSGLQLTGLDWHSQAAALSTSAVYSSSQLTTPSAQGGALAEDALLSTPAQYLQALYPPGVFTAMGALVVPWVHDGAAMTRNFARILSRLEKDDFAVIEMKAVKSLTNELIEALYRENCGEYASFTKSSSANASSAAHSEASINETVAAVLTHSAVVILVRRSSALLQLKSTIGPVFDAEIAETQYPRSLVCLLNSLGGAKFKAGSVEVPLILPTLSCASAQVAIQEVFPHFHANYKAQMAAVSLNALSEASLVGVSDSANIEHVEERSEGTGEVNGLAVQIPSNARVNTISHGAAVEVSGGAELHMISDGTVRHVDIAGVVVTHALLQEVGIGLLLEALHREGLVLRNVYTTHVTLPAAKQLQQLAGASSLSMKPPTALMTHAPLLVLGVEGPSHSFVRFKSFSVMARSAAQLWKLSGHSVHADDSHRGGVVEARAHLDGVSALSVAGEWGVLASSSTRLAKDLYKHCFEEIYGEDSVFTYA